MHVKPKPLVLDAPLVEVIWVDAAIDVTQEGSDSDFSLDSFGSLVLRHDIGYLVSMDNHKLTLAVSICVDDNTYCHSNCIPSSWIREVRVLERTTHCLMKKKTGQKRVQKKSSEKSLETAPLPSQQI
jgi:hypothetical protein